MAASLSIRQKNGPSETATDKTSAAIRFKKADNATVDSLNKLVIPVSGSDLSFETWLRPSLSGTFVGVDNIRVYTDGVGFGTGVLLWAKTQSAYTEPAQPLATTGYVNAFGYTSASSLLLGEGPYTTTGDVGSYLVLLLEVQSTAGTLSAETLTISFDELDVVDDPPPNCPVTLTIAEGDTLTILDADELEITLLIIDGTLVLDGTVNQIC